MLHQTDGWKFKLRFVSLKEYYSKGGKFEKCNDTWLIDTIVGREYFTININNGGKVPLINNAKYVLRIEAIDNNGRKIISAKLFIEALPN